MRQQATQVREMRRTFTDGKEYASKYVKGTYQLVNELFDMKVIQKFNLEQILAKFNQLTLREDLVIKCIYGIGRPKLTLEETADHFNMRQGDVKRVLQAGKIKLYNLCQAC